MDFVEIQPDCREALRRQGLCAPADFLRLPGVILCGHQDRHVLTVDLAALPSGKGLGRAFLKKEHRVPLRDRIMNALAGFGPVSKATREARTLGKLAKANIPCPTVLAHGEHGRQAFLLLSGQSGMTDIRLYMANHPNERLALARALGRHLAHMHAAGFRHGDLYSKHILVGSGSRFCILDRQRARSEARVSWRARQRDLATLDATMLDSLATDRLRLIFLRHYLREVPGVSLEAFAQGIRRLSCRLQEKSRIRALRRLPLATGKQSLVWLDGEALCVTPAFEKALGGRVPEWLRLPFAANDPQGARCSASGLGTVSLVRRRALGFFNWLPWRRREPAPEVHLAALHFRLERHGIHTPKLLAFGHKRVLPWTYSFILTESQANAGSLVDHLAKDGASHDRAIWLCAAGSLLRRLHEAGYSLGDQRQDYEAVGVCPNTNELTLVLTRLDGLKRCRQPWPALAEMDFTKLHPLRSLCRTDRMRFYLAYLGTERLTAPGRRLLREFMAKQVTA